MYLFTRQVLINPSHLRKGMAHALDMLAYVNEKTGLNTSLYQVLQGSAIGTLSFAYQTDSYAASVEQTDEMTTSDQYLAKVESGAGFFIGNPQDRVGNIVHMAGEVSGAPAAANMINARLDIGHVSAALGWSVELADYMEHLTGVPMAVLTSDSPDFGTISWLSYGESLAQLEQAESTSNGDAGFLDRIEGARDFFVPGTGASWLSRKIG